MTTSAKHFKVVKKLFVQSWFPALMAVAYATWDYVTMPSTQRTAAAFIHSWGVTFFLIMWFAGQWFRAEKHIDDTEGLTSLREKVDKSLDLLGALTETLTTEAPVIPPPALGGSKEEAYPPNEEAVARVLEEVARSPKGALLLLGPEIERELRKLLWSSGWIQGVGKLTITRSIEHLVKLGVLPENLGSSVSVFLDVRNKLLHGHGVDDDEVIRAIDIGLTILRAVIAIPVQVYEVYHPCVDVYEDAGGLRVRAEVKAVVLQATDRNLKKTLYVFPTTKTSYQKGKRVSWEWNMGRVVGESWFRHPDTGKIEPAWRSAAEFIGRNLDEL